MIKFTFLIWLIIFLGFAPVAEGRVTPEDIVVAQKESYQKSTESYTDASKMKLDNLQKDILNLNRKLTAELDYAMVVQALILDEFEVRAEGKYKSQIEDARYWITFAHEAVAYQAAKTYIPRVTGEQNFKSDASSTIGLFKSEIFSARLKVFKAEGIVKGLLKNEF
ncbi:MAG: hypothetical protein Q7S88_00175 [Candidatus Daviesbacteria bacterium]|nr:hypothetical protein [Candidatus Daviesbacteria bacterium]